MEGRDKGVFTNPLSLIQAKTALEILENWCAKTGFVWGGGIGVGGGGGLAMMAGPKPGRFLLYRFPKDSVLNPSEVFRWSCSDVWDFRLTRRFS